MGVNSTISVEGSALGNAFSDILMCEDLQPGDDVSYQMAKLIYLYHPLGAKMAEVPAAMAMSQPWTISIPDSPEEMIKEAFQKEWDALEADRHIFNVKTLSRVYGVATLVFGAVGVDTDKPIDPMTYWKQEIYFNDLDPLNTAGSLVLNQDPNAPDFQKYTTITAAGQLYRRSRSVVVMNENPIYIGYTNSAFGYVGRSIYQRALYPIKTFIQSMITDDLVTLKAGLLIAKMKGTGSIVDRAMQTMTGLKRNLLKEGKTGNVLSVGHEDAIETLNMQNADTAMTTARKNCLENIAAANRMPAKILNSESFAEGFGEGTEDADIVRYINGERKSMQPLYDYMDPIVMHRAWNPEFYKTVQAAFPEYGDIPYAKAFYNWKNSFKAIWPNLIEEPESKLSERDKVKLESIVKLLEVMLPKVDPENSTTLLEWAAANFNELKTLFQHPLILDLDALMNYTPPEQKEDAFNKFADSVRSTAIQLRTIK